MRWRAKSSLCRKPFRFLLCMRKIHHAIRKPLVHQVCVSFAGIKIEKNYLRTTLLELSFCFSALPPLVLSILAEKHFLGSSFLEKYYYVTNFSKSCLLSGELNSNWQFFPDYYRSNYTHVKEVFQPEQGIIL